MMLVFPSTWRKTHSAQAGWVHQRQGSKPHSFFISPSHGVVHSLSSAGRHGCFAQGPESTSNLRKEECGKKIQRRDTTKFKHIKSREWRQLAKCFNFEGLGLFVGGHSETTDSPHPNPTPLPSCLQPRLWQILPVESLGNGWLWEGLTGGT